MSEYTLRKGVRSERFPAFQLSTEGKYLFDTELLKQVLRQEELARVQVPFEDDGEVGAPDRSFLAN